MTKYHDGGIILTSHITFSQRRNALTSQTHHIHRADAFQICRCFSNQLIFHTHYDENAGGFAGFALVIDGSGG